MFDRARKDAHGPRRRDDAAFAVDAKHQHGYYGHMKKTGIAELKNNLSRYLDQVKSGETILVMDRNQAVAQIVPLPSAARGLVSDDDRLSRLERKGLIRRAVPGHNKWLAKHRPVKVKGSVLQGLLDERGSGW
jgi:antitoxin (DNA-binding transcriptional repressor) of toxin-antitoxin stability system